MPKNQQVEIKKDKVLINELRGTTRRLEIAFSNISDSIIITDEEGIVEWCDSAFDKLISKERSSILGARFLELLPLKTDKKEIDFPSLTLCINGNHKHYEYTKNKKKLIFNIMITRFQDTTNKQGYLFTIQEIAEKRQKERVERVVNSMAYVLSEFDYVKDILGKLLETICTCLGLNGITFGSKNLLMKKTIYRLRVKNSFNNLLASSSIIPPIISMWFSLSKSLTRLAFDPHAPAFTS